MEAINPTKSERRVYRSYRDFLKKEIIISNVIKLRKKCGIPLDKGFPFREDGEYYMPPNNWVTESKDRVIKGFAEKCLKDEGILLHNLYYLFLGYIYYNYIPEEVVFLNTTITPLCFLDDSITDDIFYPIVLRINPSITLREIIDYFKTNKKVFDKYKEKYSSNTIPTTRKRPKEKRNEEIWGLHEVGLTSTEILKKLSKIHSETDPGIITKTISVQKKKRS